MTCLQILQWVFVVFDCLSMGFDYEIIKLIIMNWGSVIFLINQLQLIHLRCLGKLKCIYVDLIHKDKKPKNLVYQFYYPMLGSKIIVIF